VNFLPKNQGFSIGDLYGRKRIFIIGGIGLITNLVLQAISPSVGFLTFMRGLDRLFSGVSQLAWVGAAVVAVGAVLAWLTYGKGKE